MAANKLVINGDKTHLIVMGTKATAARRDEVAIQAEEHVIRPTTCEKLLGGHISQDLKWRVHILRQLVFYQTVLQVHKVMILGKPDNIRRKFSREHPYPTRLASGGGVRMIGDSNTTSSLSQKGFQYRGTQSYNRIPAYIRKIPSLQTFKYKLKQWVTTNIPLD